MPVLLLLLISIPLIEIYLLIAVGKVIGAIPTIILLMATAVLGIALLRRQGRQAFVNAQSKLAAGTLPSAELAEGLLLALGGVLLLIPGFATDMLGFALLVPVIRRFLVSKGVGRFFVASSSSFSYGRSHRGPAGRHTLEGEFEREDEDRRNLP